MIFGRCRLNDWKLDDDCVREIWLFGTVQNYIWTILYKLLGLISGITISGNRSFLILWCMCASFSTAASSILQQPLYNSTLNEFDTTATITTTNAIVAAFVLTWALLKNYEYSTCFLTAAILQAITAVIFFALSFRRRR